MQMVELQNPKFRHWTLTLLPLKTSLSPLRSYTSDIQINQAFNEIENISKDQVLVERYISMSITNGIGASGAIFGLLAAFVILFPEYRIAVDV